MRAASLACVLVLAGSGCGDDGGGSAADGGPDDGGTPVDAGAGTLTFTSSVAGVTTPLPWVAAQDGDRPWQTITSDDGIYTIPLLDARWGIAYVCDGATFDQVFVFNGTLAEMTELARSCPSGVSPATGSLTIQVNGLDSNGASIVGFGNGGSLATMADPTATLDVPAGTWDTPYTVKPDNTDITRFGIVTTELGAGATITVPVNAATSTVATVNHVAAVINAGTLPVGVGCDFISAGGSVVQLRQPAASTYATVPAAALRDGDLHEVRAVVGEDKMLRRVTTYFHDGRDVALELPGPMTASFAVVATAPYRRIAITFSDLAGTQLYMFDVRPFDLGSTTHQLRWIVTPGWLGTAASHDWEQPDFSGLDGWLDEWGIPDDGRQLSWSHTANATTGDSSPLEYLERPPETPWFNVPGSWDGDVVTRTIFSDFTAPL